MSSLRMNLFLLGVTRILPRNYTASSSKSEISAPWKKRACIVHIIDVSQYNWFVTADSVHIHVLVCSFTYKYMYARFSWRRQRRVCHTPVNGFALPVIYKDHSKFLTHPSSPKFVKSWFAPHPRHNVLKKCPCYSINIFSLALNFSPLWH